MTSTMVASVKSETGGIPEARGRLPEFKACISGVLHQLYRMVDERIKGRMAEWSRAVQREEVAAAETKYGWGGHWDIDHNDSEVDWVPNELTTVVDVTRADENIADIIAANLVEDIILEAEDLLLEDPTRADSSHDYRIELVFCFPDEELTDDKGNHRPMPAGGLALWADATLVPSSLPHYNDVSRTRD